MSRLTGSPLVRLVADRVALEDREHPILVFDVDETFRVIPRETHHGFPPRRGMVAMSMHAADADADTEERHGFLAGDAMIAFPI